jgi:hypothetical protein
MTKNVKGKGCNLSLPKQYKKQKNIVCFGQVPWDAAKWAVDPHNKHTSQMVEDVAQYKDRVWYKPHPLFGDNRTDLQKLGTDIAIHSLWENLEIAVSLCSNTSLEAVAAGRPGCVYSPNHFVPEEILPRGLEAGLGHVIDPELRDKWLDFLIHVYQIRLSDPARLVARIEGD